MAAAFERGAVLALWNATVADAGLETYPADRRARTPSSPWAPSPPKPSADPCRRAAAAALTVIGITGSAGKTTTKDLLAGILANRATTVAPQGSYNGEVGVPLTVFTAGFDTRYLVIEMGATGIGHIRYLADMVKPDIGVGPGRRHGPRRGIRRSGKHRHRQGRTGRGPRRPPAPPS